MDMLIKRRSITALAVIVIVTVVVIVAGVTALAAPRPAGHHSTVSQPANRAVASAEPPVRPSPPKGTGASSSPTVQLATQDITPSAHFVVTASGFGRSEPLLVTVADMQGHQYEQVTLTANTSGALADTQLVPPQSLGSGTYQLTVAGGKSHRTASVTFRMHDDPPTIALDTYYAKPGQEVGFTGAGFIAGERVTVSLGPAMAQLASVQATGTGAISGVLAIPALAPGAYTLTMQGVYSQTPVSVGFNIQGFAPWVVLDRYFVAPGENIGLTGQGFGPGEQVLVYLNAPRGAPVMRLTADTAGQITVQDSWTPTGLTGRNTLIFVGQSSKATTSVDFTVQPAAEAPAQPTTAPSTP